MIMENVILIAKVCVVAFFGTIFIWNMVDLVSFKTRGRFNNDLYFEKQLWMIVSLLAIAITLGNL